ncbi:unnamed protein product, partial [marine sediment metagenome]
MHPYSAQLTLLPSRAAWAFLNRCETVIQTQS